MWIAEIGRIRLYVIPHWLMTAIAWTAFVILWRKARKPPVGHCQECGYNLTGNISGKCPECNAEVPEKRARKDSNPQPSVPKTDALSN